MFIRCFAIEANKMVYLNLDRVHHFVKVETENGKWEVQAVEWFEEGRVHVRYVVGERTWSKIPILREE